MAVSEQTLRTLYLNWSKPIPTVDGGAGIVQQSSSTHTSFRVSASLLVLAGRSGQSRSFGAMSVVFDKISGEPLTINQSFHHRTPSTNSHTLLSVFHHPVYNCVTLYGVTATTTYQRTVFGQKINYDPDTGALTPGPLAEVLLPGTTTSDTIKGFAIGNTGPSSGRVIGYREGPLTDPRIVTFDLNLTSGTATTPVYHTFPVVFGGSYNRAFGTPTPLVGSHPQAAFRCEAGVNSTSGDTFIVSYSGGAPTSTLVSLDFSGSARPSRRYGSITYAGPILAGGSTVRLTTNSSVNWPGVSATSMHPTIALPDVSGEHGSYWDATTLLADNRTLMFEYDPIVHHEKDIGWVLDPARTSWASSAIRMAEDGHYWWSSGSGHVFEVWGDPLWEPPAPPPPTFVAGPQWAVG